MQSNNQNSPFLPAPPYTPTSATSSYARRPPHYPPRVDSPPSSAFFSSRPNNEHDMQPSPDAQRHFGSSTSFRRHGSGSVNSHGAGFPAFQDLRSAVAEDGPSGIWDRLVGFVKGGVKFGGAPEENGYELAPKVDQTPSSKYSSYDAEVRSFPVPSPQFPPKRRVHGRMSSPNSEPPLPMA